MSTELTDISSCVPHTTLQESEFDDALEVPDSLEITIDENGETIQINEEETKHMDNTGINLYT